MTTRCPELIRAGLGYARCHRPPGHTGPCHAAGRTWFPAGDAGQRLRMGVPCLVDCIPLPGPALRHTAQKTTARKQADGSTKENTMTTLTRTLANQEIPGSRYDPERDLDTIASGDTDYHEPSCHCMFCRDWEFWRNAPSEDHPVVP